MNELGLQCFTSNMSWFYSLTISHVNWKPGLLLIMRRWWWNFVLPCFLFVFPFVKLSCDFWLVKLFRKQSVSPQILQKKDAVRRWASCWWRPHHNRRHLRGRRGWGRLGSVGRSCPRSSAVIPSFTLLAGSSFPHQNFSEFQVACFTLYFLWTNSTNLALKVT